jgi:hypothetical protein
MQGPELLARGNFAVRVGRGAARLFGQHLDDRVDARIDRLDAAKMRLDDLGAGKIFSCDPLRQLAGRKSPKLHRDILPSPAGAYANCLGFDSTAQGYAERLSLNKLAAMRGPAEATPTSSSGWSSRSEEARCAAERRRARHDDAAGRLASADRRKHPWRRSRGDLKIENDRRCSGRCRHAGRNCRRSQRGGLRRWRVSRGLRWASRGCGCEQARRCHPSCCGCRAALCMAGGRKGLSLMPLA